MKRIGEINMSEEEQTMEEKTQEEAPQEDAEEVSNEDEALEAELEANEERLPFPNARVVALMKTELDDDKMIRARVKKEMNEWLGDMCRRVTREMNKIPYTMVEGGDFHRAIKKYEQLEQVAEQKERLITYMDRIKQDCNVLIGDVERSFDVGESDRRKRTLSASAKAEMETESSTEGMEAPTEEAQE